MGSSTSTAQKSQPAAPKLIDGNIYEDSSPSEPTEPALLPDLTSGVPSSGSGLNLYNPNNAKLISTNYLNGTGSSEYILQYKNNDIYIERRITEIKNIRNNNGTHTREVKDVFSFNNGAFTRKVKKEIKLVNGLITVTEDVDYIPGHKNTENLTVAYIDSILPKDTYDITSQYKSVKESFRYPRESFTDPVHKAGEITAIVCLVICLIVYALLLVFMFILPKRAAKQLTKTEVKPEVKSDVKSSEPSK